MSVTCFYVTDTILFMWLTEHSCQYIDYLQSNAEERIWEGRNQEKILLRETEAFTENNHSCTTLTTTPPIQIAMMQQNNSDKFCKLCYNISLHQGLILILHCMSHTLMPVPVLNVTFTFFLLIPTKVHKTKVLPSLNQKYFSVMQNLTPQITATNTFSCLIFCFTASQISIPSCWTILGKLSIWTSWQPFHQYI
jgi:hypothetical protein